MENVVNIGPEDSFSPKQEPEAEAAFRRDLAAVINCHSKENGSRTPDFILAAYLADCLRAWDTAMHARERWYGLRATCRTILAPDAGQNCLSQKSANEQSQ